MERKTLFYKERELYYRQVGRGPAVMLLHGFGEDGEIWKRQWPVLENYRLIIPDLPGSGHSSPIPDMSMEGLAEAAAFLLKTLAIERCTLIGHSMGGYIALAFAELYPRLLQGFGLFHSSAFADSDEKKATRRKGIDFIQNNGATAFLKTSIPNLFGPETKTENPELIEQQIADSHNFSGSALVSYYESMMKRPDRTHILRSSAVPVLFIMGRHDAAVPLEDGLKQCFLPEKSYIHILERSGHMGMLEETKLSNRLVKEFLDSIT
ncbi:MAG TPA: alpha/beta hydrolase [Flavisolibacter sp.]|nr:alpha/beta hydrolase [Flavisolibacter sp.]